MGSYIPNTGKEQLEMLKSMGYSSMDDLFAAIPDDMKLKDGLDLPEGKSELEVSRIMKGIAAKNRVFSSIFRGAGAYNHYIPAVVGSVLSNESVQTAYTPYQAEISQGLLQSIFEYQTMICDLTGMDASNASVYDGAEAAAEGIAMCRDKKRNRALISAAVLPAALETVKTYCFGNEMELEIIPEKNGVTDLDYLKEHMDKSVACVYIQHPNYYGNLEDAEATGAAAHEAGAKFILGIHPIAAAILKSPRECGADIAVGEGQPLGMPLAFGGPYLGFMACTQALFRKLPGRIVGETVDAADERCFVLTLQAREQHIRREKASSNICSNQALCAMRAAVYLAAMGPQGLQKAAQLSYAKAHYLAEELEKIGFPRRYPGAFFQEFVTETPLPAEQILAKLEAHDILGGYPVEGGILWCTTEKNTKAQIDALIGLLKEVCA